MDKEHQPINLEKPIVLIGFMGVGKTTVGQLLAQKLETDFVDLDQAIEAEEGLKISQIFERFGEAHFRQLERRALRRLMLDRKKQVIALGGGAYLQEEIRKLCLKEGQVIFLNVSWEEWLKRLNKLRSTRPLLKNNDLASIKRLYDQRLSVYSTAPIHIKTDGLTPQEVVQNIMAQIK